MIECRGKGKAIEQNYLNNSSEIRQSPGSSSRAIQDNRIDISEFFRNAGPHPDGKQNSRDPSLIGIRKLIIMIPGTLPHH